MKFFRFIVPVSGFVGLLGPSSVQAQELSITPANDGTGTVVTFNGNQFDITNGTSVGNNVLHSFGEFGLQTGETANFIVVPGVQNILGRVVGNNPSMIDGLIQVSGTNSNLYLVNPTGIFFGPNASLNVGGSFQATTADGVRIGESWFKAIGENNYATLIGNPNAFAFTSDAMGSIINAGDLTVPAGETITLLGGIVINTGTLTAPGRRINVTAVAGEQLVEVQPEGSLLSLTLPVADKATLTEGIDNNQALTPTALPELLTGGNLSEASGVVVEEGVVRLTDFETEIPNQPGVTIASGKIDASGETGGDVAILGDVVGVVGGQIDVSGISGGGTALIGGDYKGLSTVSNAMRTIVSQDSQIAADALEAGDGGKVIVWADDFTGFYGEVSARGGEFYGDGGFVEVSGKQSLVFRGDVDVTSTNGLSGTVLLDPEDIIISDGGGGEQDKELSR